MKAQTRPQRLVRLLATSAIALCLTLGLSASPGFDLSLQPAFGKGLGGKGGKGGSGGKADRGGKADAAGKADMDGSGGRGGPGGGGGKGGGAGRAERGAGPAATESALAGPEEETEETIEEGLLPKPGGGDDFDRRRSGLDSASSLSTTAGLNRFLWILPPEEVAAATQGEAEEVPTGQPAKIAGVALPLRAVLAVPLDLPPRPGGKPLFVKLPPKPAAKPVRALVPAEERSAAGLAGEAPGRSGEAAVAIPSDPAVRQRSADETAEDGEAPVFGVDDAPPETGTEAAGSGRGTADLEPVPFYDAPEGPARAEERALEAEEADERVPAAGAEEGQAPLPRDTTLDSEARPPEAGGEEASLGLRLRGAIAQAISWGSSLLFAPDEKS